MTRDNDQTYLLNEQYRDASNLNARVALHARFSTNTLGFHRWVFDQMALGDEARVLELGSGPGWLWRKNADRIPAGWQIALSDFSPGMVAECQQHLNGMAGHFTCQQIDAQSIPHPDGAFDAVIANHMLYHVPDRARAMAEIARVLTPEGVLIAATNGEGHLREINDLLDRIAAAAGVELEPNAYFRSKTTFTLENGAAQIGTQFRLCELRRYADGLMVTEVEPLVAFIASGLAVEQMTDDLLAASREVIAGQMARSGAIDITKSTGVFLARK